MHTKPIYFSSSPVACLPPCLHQASLPASLHLPLTPVPVPSSVSILFFLPSPFIPSILLVVVTAILLPFSLLLSSATFVPSAFATTPVIVSPLPLA